MKQFFNIKRLAFVLIIVLLLTFAVACDKENDNGNEVDIPEFSIQLVDGDKSINLTDKDMKDIDLKVVSTERRGNVTFYKGFDVWDILNKKDIKIDGIKSIDFAEIVEGEEPFERTLNGEDFVEKAVILAVYFADKEDGEYQKIGAEKGPVRAVGEVDIQGLNSIVINR